MSDTTGWRCHPEGYYYKEIDGTRYEIHKGRDGQWWAWTYNTNIAHEPLLADAKRAAHRHAEGKG